MVDCSVFCVFVFLDSDLAFLYFYTLFQSSS